LFDNQQDDGRFKRSLAPRQDAAATSSEQGISDITSVPEATTQPMTTAEPLTTTAILQTSDATTVLAPTSAPVSAVPTSPVGSSGVPDVPQTITAGATSRTPDTFTSSSVEVRPTSSVIYETSPIIPLPTTTSIAVGPSPAVAVPSSDFLDRNDTESFIDTESFNATLAQSYAEAEAASVLEGFEPIPVYELSGDYVLSSTIAGNLLLDTKDNAAYHTWISDGGIIVGANARYPLFYYPDEM
jgi:hypothetical protein